MRKILREHDILQPVEVGPPHEHLHLLVDQNDIVLSLDYAVHVYVHGHAEAVVDIGAHESEDKLENLGSDIELHFADVDPLKGRDEVHRLRLWQDQLLVQHTDAESLEVDLHEQLSDEL